MENSQLISVDKLPELLKHDYTFIDLRDPLQFNKIHLRKFINIPYDTFIATPPQFPKDKPIYLICYSGKRSLDLAQKLTRCGYHAYTPSINNFIDEIMLIYYHNNRSKLPYSHKVHIFCDIIGT